MRKRQKDPKQRPPSEGTLKKALSKSGYSDDTTDKIWKWYNPQKKKAATKS